jgi:tetraacyldisaccharide 4'-kinase
MPPLSAPEFWTRGGARARLASHLLQPLALGHWAAGAARRALARPFHAPVPVVCVGNVVAGGAGKTPVAMSLAHMATGRGLNPHILSRGYGGRISGPIAVDPARHDARAVGDEPLLLAGVAPTWIARDRVAGARAAAAAGAGIIILDDGFQNPLLAKDRSLLVVDGGYGFGNGRVIPAGPLREPVAAALARADAVVLLGEDEAHLLPQLGATPVLRATLAPVGGEELREARVVAFAGIGRPEKFFRTLEALGAKLAARHAFADHHLWREDELLRLGAEAERFHARLVTTEKDWVRLPLAWRRRIAALKVAILWQDEAAVAALFDGLTRPEARNG